MTQFFGTGLDDIIVPGFVSPGVGVSGTPATPSDAIDSIDAGAGNDVVGGGRGNDTALMGDGDDRFVWNPGDGSDVVDGQAGTDTLQFNGANISEVFNISTNGARVNLTRNIAAVSMDLNSVERIELNTLGGADTLNISEMTGTALREVVVNLSAAGGAGDGAADTVSVNGRRTAETITLTQDTLGVSVLGLSATTRVTGGEVGVDTLVVKGDAGNDVLDARAIAAPAIKLTLDGGDGDDRLLGSGGNDLLLGGEGNDRVLWNLGAGQDVVDGGIGNDTVELNGVATAEQYFITANGGRVLVTGADPSLGSVDIAGVEDLLIRSGAGDDTVIAGNGIAALIRLTLDGGAGNDMLTGGDGDDTLIGGLGNDLITGGRGNDTALMGDGDDRFVWNPGDGSDVVDGQVGTDTLAFNGANIAEIVSIGANGTRVSMTRNVASISMDLNNMERIEFNALAGADSVSVGDMSGTALRQVVVNLGIPGGGGDGAADGVSVIGRNIADTITLTQDAQGVLVQGLTAQTRISNGEVGLDTLTVVGGGGNDNIDARTITSPTLTLKLDGGEGNDSLRGGNGADWLLGGAGNDIVRGGGGADIAQLGEGDDRYLWLAGDGDHSVIGESGNDTLSIQGSAATDTVVLRADSFGNWMVHGSNVVNFSGMENVHIAALDGSDNITVDDLTGAGIGQVTVELAGVLGGTSGDGQVDRVTLRGSANGDHLVVTPNVDGLSVSGLGAQLKVAHLDAARDQLTLAGGDGDDLIDATLAPLGARVQGDAGNDTAILSAGDDRFIWNVGDGSDVVEGLGGSDTLQFNGSAGDELISIAANAAHVSLARDFGTVNMDLNNVERIEFNADAGQDVVFIAEMSGTALKETVVNLNTSAGTGDAQADRIVVSGRGVADTINLTQDVNGLRLQGLSAQTRVIGGEAALDILVVSANAGNDSIDARSILAPNIKLALDGGSGDDRLMGSGGNDLLLGGEGNDRVLWNVGSGDDVMEGGDGSDTAEISGGTTQDQLVVIANGTRVFVAGASPAVGSVNMGGVESLLINGGGGDDLISASNGLSTLTRITLDGGSGNDTLTGGDGADTLIGGSGDDLIAGGRGNDTALMGTGDDRFVWNPGDGNDVVEGQDGTDTLQLNAANIGENLSITANGARVAMSRDVGGVSLDLNSLERIELNTLGGADKVAIGDMTGTALRQVVVNLGTSAGAGDGLADRVFVNSGASADVFTLVQDTQGVMVQGLSAQTLVINGEAGLDLLSVSSGAGNDIINALAFDPSNLNILIDGGTGTDVIKAQGSDVDDNSSLFANGAQARLQQSLGAVDMSNVETVSIATQGGSDSILISDLSGTGITQVNVDLAQIAGGTQGDAGTDQIRLVASLGSDHITATQTADVVRVIGLAAGVTVSRVEAALDRIILQGDQGDDVIDTRAVTARVELAGDAGNDLLMSGAGNDIVGGGRGNDVATLGAGDDLFLWNPGDGSDIVDGESGFDTLNFQGANIAENIALTFDGSQVRLTRDIAAITTELDAIERVEIRTIGGADNVTVSDMAGSSVQQVMVDLSATNGLGDGLMDRVTLHGTSNADSVSVTQSGNGIQITGLTANIEVRQAEANQDQIIISGERGNDLIDARAIVAPAPILVLDGGDGNDRLLGGAGQDILVGGVGDDVLYGGAGYDFLTGGAGDDVFNADGGVIEDFHAGAGTEDRIDVRGVVGATDFSWIMGHVTDSFGDTVLDLGNGEALTLRSVSSASLNAGDFIF